MVALGRRLERLRRKHGALWIDVRWTMLYGIPCWAVYAELHPSGARVELARAPFLRKALRLAEEVLVFGGEA